MKVIVTKVEITELGQVKLEAYAVHLAPQQRDDVRSFLQGDYNSLSFSVKTREVLELRKPKDPA